MGSTYYSNVGLIADERLSVRDLLTAVLVPSGTDAIYTLADHLGDGSVDEFAQKMNEAGYRPRSRRIDEGSAWISLDFLDVVVHIFTDEARDYYRLESFWRAVPQERWEE